VSKLVEFDWTQMAAQSQESTLQVVACSVQSKQQKAFDAPDIPNSSSFIIKPCNLLKFVITTAVVKASCSSGDRPTQSSADDCGRTWEVEKDRLG
jgi:hypothetical protein